ncbi:MAG: (deoxy)nucleoside triphosphate pyrophosphohydrolase [Chloroflexales bacterium]|nr:(deoxy)nucleoside triphosphate pyrophosphohydrolase [Chloroflexales bacterium]
MAHPIRVAAAVITRADGAVLLARRRAGKAHAGLWEFPGGKLEPGETPEQCLARELREELGVAVVVGAYVATGLDGPVKLLGYRARILSGEPRLTDHDALAWVAPPDLGAYPLPPADLPIAAALLALRD